MMTSENNADRMLTKSVALSLRTARRCCAFGVLLSAGLAACSYRAPDKAALHTKTAAFDPIATVMAKPQAIVEEPSVIGAKAVSTFPLANKSVADASSTSGKRSVKSAVASIDRVVGDASVTLSMSTMDDVPVVAVVAGKKDPAASDTLHHSSEPSTETRVSAFSWKWLLAALAVIVAAGMALMRHLRRRADTRANAHFTSSEDEASIAFEDASATASVEPAPALRSSLEWSFQAPNYERQEHWDVLSPVDFLPVSLAAYVPHEVDEQPELTWMPAEPEEICFSEEIESESAQASDGGALGFLPAPQASHDASSERF